MVAQGVGQHFLLLANIIVAVVVIIVIRRAQSTGEHTDVRIPVK